jgi:hypothetical protein
MSGRANWLLAALLVGAHAHGEPPRETLYESSLGPNGGAPWQLSRAQLERMGGVWSGERFITHETFPNTNDPHAATFVAQVTYTPVRRPASAR